MSLERPQRRVWIRGTGDYREAVEGDRPPALKTLVQESLGVPVRRVGRFIQLALIGAGRCAADRAPDADTAVYMSSARGDLETTLDVVETLFRHGMPPMPLSFVNTVSNAPCYYVARHFALAGRSNFVCSRSFAFESVLDLALLDIESGYMDSALAGSVDIATSPVADHRRRLQISRDEPIAEGSHWMWLHAGECPDDALGELVAAREFGDRDELIDWLGGQTPPIADTCMAIGQFAARADVAAVREATGIERRFEPPRPPGFYDSQSGATINAFLHDGRQRWLVHLNGEIDGPRCTATIVRRLDRTT
jgi:hypothetical protein